MRPKSMGSLESVDLREIWVDEAREFTPWLAEAKNLARLSDALEMDLELEGVEVPVGPYSADIVANDTVSNSRVVIENQLEKTNHDHLGKILTYASGLDARVIIWIAKEFTEEHRRAIDYLNDKAAPDLCIYALEVKVYRIGPSDPAPQFKIIAKPNEYSASVKKDERGFTETKALYLELWNAFRDHLKSAGSMLSQRKARAQHWYTLAIGRSKFQISLTASTMHKRLGCEIYIRGSNAKQAFKLLQRDKEAIEKITGPLDWQELPDGKDCRIVLYRQDVDVLNRQVWPDAFKWLHSTADIFQKAFAQRIKALPIEDEPEENDTHEEN